MNKSNLRKLIQNTIKEFIEEELNFDNIAQDIDFEEIPDDKSTDSSTSSDKTTNLPPKQDTTTKGLNFKDKYNITKQADKLKNIDKKLKPKPVKLKDI